MVVVEGKGENAAEMGRVEMRVKVLVLMGSVLRFSEAVFRGHFEISGPFQATKENCKKRAEPLQVV